MQVAARSFDVIPIAPVSSPRAKAPSGPHRQSRPTFT